MKIPRWLLVFSAVALGPLSAQEAVQDDGSQTTPLAYRAQRAWSIVLPEETFTPVGTGWAFSKTAGCDFKAAVEGTNLAIDTDGDGNLDVRVDGPEGTTKLRGKTTAGEPFLYAVRLEDRKGWHYAPGGFVIGKIGDTKIRIIDQNNDGSFDDVGLDAMIVGDGDVATFLSQVVTIGDQPYSITVAADGSSLSYRPYDGKTGTLSLGLETTAKVLAVIVTSTDGRYAFDLASRPEGLRVPAGRYIVHRGDLGLGANRMKFKQARARPLTVEADATATLAWGGPVRAEFDYQRQGDEVALSPDHVWYYGAGGEQYYDFAPLGKSPTFSFVNKKTGREIATAYFPGTC